MVLFGVAPSPQHIVWTKYVEVDILFLNFGYDDRSR